MSHVIASISGQAVPVIGNDIDTDRVIPARFMKEVTFDNMGQYLFYDARFNEDGTLKNFPLNQPQYQSASILISGKNFGCGSSREHAPQALMRHGIKALIAESFAEIFAGNCKSLGIPAVTMSEGDIQSLTQSVESDPTLTLTINLSDKRVEIGGQAFEIGVTEDQQKSFVNGLWNVNVLLANNKELISQTAKDLPYINF